MRAAAEHAEIAVQCEREAYEADNAKATARTEIKALEDKLATLKTCTVPKPRGRVHDLRVHPRAAPAMIMPWPHACST